MEYSKKQENFKPVWITKGITPEVVSWCESFGKYLASNQGDKSPLTTSQLRKFFGEVKRIEMNLSQEKDDSDNISEITMLKPLLAYAVGRKLNNRGICTSKIEFFNEEISTAIDIVLNNKEHYKECFKNFVQIFEAIVAYHKMYGGKENGGN